LLEDLCRIIASEWLVFNTYIERELNNIEGWFEELGENCNEKQLHDLLHQLMRARRRVTKYDTLVSDQLQLCPAHWRYESSREGSCPISSIDQPAASNRFSSPLQDFHQVSNHLAHNKTRISQAIKMVTSLMAVRLNNLVAEQSRTLVRQNDLIVAQNKVVAEQSGTLVKQNDLIVAQNKVAAEQSTTMVRQNKLSEARNSSLAFLTGVTSFLLPFTTVAAFMAIPSDSGFGPGSEKQWIYWVSSGVLALTLVLTFFLDFRWENWRVNKMGGG
jgi:Mg2+ and Co2+ transporter CorA